jgi:hypothetical protein
MTPNPTRKQAIARLFRRSKSVAQVLIRFDRRIFAALKSCKSAPAPD